MRPTVVNALGLPSELALVGIGADELGMDGTEESVLRELKRMKSGRVLSGVAYLLSNAEGRGNPAEHWDFVHRLYANTPLAARLRELENDSGVGRRLIAARPLLRVAQQAVVQDSDPDLVTPAQLRRDDLLKIVEWALVLADLNREAAAGSRSVPMAQDEVALELARFQWFSQPPSIGDVDRAHAVMIEHSSPAARSQLDVAVEHAYGVTLEELWGVLVIEWVRASAGNGTIPRVDGPWVSEEMSEERYEVARRSIRQDVGALRALVKADFSSGNVWQYTAFRNRPVTRTTNEVDLALRPAFVGEKATLTGMFHLVGSAYRQKFGESQYGSYAGEIGMAVDRRCRELVAQATHRPAKVMWEEELQTTVTADSRKTCDAIWVLRRRWVAMDFVHRQPTLAAQATGDLSDFARELQVSVVEKLHQVDETLQRVLTRGACAGENRPTEVLPVIVNGAGSAISGVVETVLAMSLRTESWRTFGQDSRVLEPAVIGLDDLERAAGLARTGKANLGSLLAGWRRSELAAASFSYWLWYQRDRGALPKVPNPPSPSERAVKIVTGAR